MGLQFAFNLAFFLDAACTQQHATTSSFGVALESATGDGVDVAMFPAKCDGENYRVYINSHPSVPSNITIPQDLNIVYYQGAYINVDLESTCRFQDNSHLWQPASDNGASNFGPFYVKVQTVPEYTARCRTLPPTPTTSNAPEHRKIDDDDDVYYYQDSGVGIFLFVFLIVFSFSIFFIFCYEFSSSKDF